MEDDVMALRLFFCVMLWMSAAAMACESAATGDPLVGDPSMMRENTMDDGSFKTTVLYDNYVFQEDTRAEWGFACLIETDDQTILFDTGGDGDVLLHNADALNVDLQQVDVLVLSHYHWDHVGGVEAVLELKTGLKVYIPESFPEEFVHTVEGAGSTIFKVDEPVEIVPGVFSTGEMGSRIKEQSLLLDVEDGIVIVTGCSHQGIVAILDRAKEVLDRGIAFVFGGFHLMQHSDGQMAEIIQAFHDIGVQKCGATHCTGDHQIDLFRESFADRYVPIGTGRVFEF
jgi:7,8-dihydropterin-6-yl-methyl-4-(beta-D-ribofuranosyl)aminobenzene 5'-phosphate synthase